jgi:hypothetical protein
MTGTWFSSRSVLPPDGRDPGVRVALFHCVTAARCSEVAWADGSGLSGLPDFGVERVWGTGCRVQQRPEINGEGKKGDGDCGGSWEMVSAALRDDRDRESVERRENLAPQSL